jgi:hypothetical protein
MKVSKRGHSNAQHSDAGRARKPRVARLSFAETARKGNSFYRRSRSQAAGRQPIPRSYRATEGRELSGLVPFYRSGDYDSKGCAD